MWQVYSNLIAFWLWEKSCLDCILADSEEGCQSRWKRCSIRDFVLKKHTKNGFTYPFTRHLISVFAFLFVKANSKEICEEISFPSFFRKKKLIWAFFLLRFKASYFENMRGYPRFSSWIPISLAKVCFFHVVQTWRKQTVYQHHLRFLIFSLMVKCSSSSSDLVIWHLHRPVHDMKIFSYKQAKGGNKHLFPMQYFGGESLLQSCYKERWKRRPDHLENVCAWREVIN